MWSASSSSSEKQRQTSLRPRAAGWIMLESQGKTSGLTLPSPAEREPAVSPTLLEEYREKEKQTPKSTRCLMISFDLILLQRFFSFPTGSGNQTRQGQKHGTWTNKQLFSQRLYHSRFPFGLSFHVVSILGSWVGGSVINWNGKTGNRIGLGRKWSLLY